MVVPEQWPGETWVAYSERLLRHAESLRAAAEDGRKLGEAYRAMADRMLFARIEKYRKASSKKRIVK